MQGSLMLDIAGTWLTAEDRQLLRQPEVGGVILFARNIEHARQVQDLCRAIRAVRPDILLAVDQEGGRVQRLRQGFVSLPAMGRFIEHPQAADLAKACGWIMASEVQAVGLDFSFAPVLDLNHGRSAVIGTRSFAHNADAAVQLAGAFIEGMHAAGMAATGKHFPGHGWAEADSHVAIPVDDRPWSQIQAVDLQPFARLSHVLDAVMPAHVIFSQVDAQPAGFSKHWLQKVLRQGLGFGGVIFSDDLSMAGAHVAGDAGERLWAALEAGCDMGLVCNDRAAAELALSRLQQAQIKASPVLGRMKGQRVFDDTCKQSPDWRAALGLLQSADLVSV